jgi:Carboxypeptidase regulatory-like domain
MRYIKSFLTIGIISLCMNLAVFAQQTGSLAGQVGDTLGASIVGATITVVSADGKEKTATSNQNGDFTINGLAAGTYTVRVIAPNFALFENTEVVIAAGQRKTLDVALTIATAEEQVDVSDGEAVSNDPNNNASATVLKEKDLEALPDDPDELEAALQALAGPSAGPNGGQIYIDGFTGGRLPPKEAIREIRINQNPFSAEYDRLGFGRIEILTKPGSDKWRGQAFLNFNDESLNSRNPFAPNRAASQTRFFGGSISGPIQKGKSSFFLDVNNREIDNNAVVNAQILDSGLNITNFREEFQLPNRRISVSPRFDYQINTNNTLVARYSFTRATIENQGIGDTSLQSRAYDTKNTEHEIRLTETMIINAKTVNETRFQYQFGKREQIGDNSVPTINVAAAFTGGGSQIGLSFNRANSWELQNYTTTTLGKNSQHSIKFGARLRGISIKDRSENNFGGTFTFTGIAEVLSSPNCDRTVTGCIVTAAISPIEQYRQNLLGNTDPRFNPTQFSLSTGEPLESISQTDVGLFATDDWRISPALTLSFGLRYENQTNISDSLNFAPRFSFAWSPGAGGARAPKTVIRGGFGIFYDRFSENFSLQAERFDGVSQLNLFVSANETDPVRRQAALNLLNQPIFTLNGVTNIPTATQIQAVLPSSSTIRTISDNLQSPYTIQTTVGVERQLPARTTLSLFYIGSRTLHQLRLRNINAPICPLQVNCNTAPRPNPTLGNINQYESSGVLNQNQFIANFRTLLSNKFTLFGNYRLGFAKGDTDGAGSYPAYTYDLSNEYGRSAFDIRHNFVIGGNFTIPWNVSLSPFIIASSGRPFNITQGVDINGDGVTAERPTYGAVNARCAQLGLNNSFCDIAGNDPNAVIPRNYGQSPSYFSVNLRVGKNFGFGSSGSSQTAQTGRQGTNRPQGGQVGGLPGGGRDGQGGGGGGRGPGGFGGFGGGGNERKPYNLNVGINFNNLFNTVNLGTPIGILNSSRFGQSTSTSGGFGGFGGGGGGAANRRIELQMRFSW